MKNRVWLIIFLLILVAHLTCIQTGYLQGQYLLKPLIIPALAGYFLVRTSGFPHSLKKWILSAMFFSWAGDVLLMFNGELYFLLGLSAFLIAHIFYIITFHRIRIIESIKSNAWLLLPVVVYYGFLISWLSPWLGDMKLPVRVYGIVISFMLLLALHLGTSRTTRGGGWMMAGAILFIISDSLLAIGKFYDDFMGAGLLIMVSYGTAQLMIAEGAALYFRQSNTR